MQLEVDAVLADLLQDALDKAAAEEVDSGFESDNIEEAAQEEGQPMDGVKEEAEEIDSDAETIDNNRPDQVEDIGSESDSNNDSDNDSELDINEVTLRRAMCVRQRFFRHV